MRQRTADLRPHAHLCKEVLHRWQIPLELIAPDAVPGSGNVRDVRLRHTLLKELSRLLRHQRASGDIARDQQGGTVHLTQ